MYLCDVVVYDFKGFGFFVHTLYAAMDDGTFYNHNRNVIPTQSVIVCSVWLTSE